MWRPPGRPQSWRFRTRLPEDVGSRGFASPWRPPESWPRGHHSFPGGGPCELRHEVTGGHHEARHLACGPQRARGRDGARGAERPPLGVSCGAVAQQEQGRGWARVLGGGPGGLSLEEQGSPTGSPWRSQRPAFRSRPLLPMSSDKCLPYFWASISPSVTWAGTAAVGQSAGRVRVLWP